MRRSREGKRRCLMTMAVAVLPWLLVPVVGSEAPGGGLIPKDQVNSERIARIFKGAYVETSIDPDGDVRLVDDGFPVFVKRYEDNELLAIYALLRFKKGTPRAAQLELVNTLNDQTLLNRYSVTQDGFLYVDYYLSYSAGLRPVQLVRSYQTFLKALRGAIARYDTGDILE